MVAWIAASADFAGEAMTRFSCH